MMGSKKLGIKYNYETGEYVTENYKRNYRVYDWLEGCMIVGRCETLEQAVKICDMFCEDTDGECCLEVRKYNPETNKFDIYVPINS